MDSETPTKNCKSCETVKPLTNEFWQRYGKSKQYKYWRHICRECRKAERREWYRKRADAGHVPPHTLRNWEWLDDYMTGKGCVDCGETDRVVLEFDHRNPEDKEVEIGKKLRGLRLEVLQAEVEKCDVVCANCHKRRTAKQQAWRKANV